MLLPACCLTITSNSLHTFCALPLTPLARRQLGEADAVTIDQICREHGVRLLLLRSYGLVGYLRPSVREQCIVESKPDSKVDDLRWVREAGGAVQCGAVRRGRGGGV